MSSDLNPFSIQMVIGGSMHSANRCTQEPFLKSEILTSAFLLIGKTGTTLHLYGRIIESGLKNL